MSFGFGQSTAQPSTGLFGQPAQQATGGLFGQQQQQQPTTSLFGQQQAAQPQAGAAAGGGLFGAPAQPATGGLFGQQQQQQPAAGGGLFGNAQPQQQQQQQPSTGLFGQPAQQQTQPATGGLFGATATQPTQPAGGLFGSTTAGAGGGLFGNPAQTTQQQQPAAGGHFGAPAQQNQATQPQGGGLFGSTAPSQPATTGFSLFGRPAAPTLGQSIAQPTTATQQQQGSQQTGGAPAIFERVQEVYNAWDPSSPSCRFQHYFYNVVDPQQVGMYGKPPNATNDALWQKAVRENPDPTCLVPALALGFEDVKKRADAQTANAIAQQQKLAELASRLDAIAQKHTLSTSLRAQRASVMQTQLKQRITALVENLYLLIPTVRSSSIRPEEEALRAALESIDEELKRPGGLGRMKGKLSELWGLLASLTAMKERARQAGVEGPTEWAVVDEGGLNELAQILHNEQQGLVHLTKILKDSMADVETIETGIGAKTAQPAPKTGLTSSLSTSRLTPSRGNDLTVSMLRPR